MNLRVLFVEDNPDDAELMLRRLRHEGIDPQWDRVQTEAALRETLTAGEQWQVALVDYNMPGFTGMDALRVLAELIPDVPAVTVSGDISEETAVETMRAGAVDYVLKDRLVRLAPAVRRAVEDAELRRRQRRDAELARQAQFTIDHSTVGLMRVTEGGTIVYANDAVAKTRGVPREDLIGHAPWETNLAVDEADARELAADALAGGEWRGEVPLRRLDGETRTLDVALSVIEHEGERHIVVWEHDVTDQRATEARARASDANYRRMVETASEGVWALDAEQRTTFANAQMASMLGFAAEEMVGRPLVDFLFEEDVGDVQAMMGRRAGGSREVFERRFRRADGSELWTLVSAVPDLGQNGEFHGSFGMFADITDRRLAQDEVRRQAKRLSRTVDGTVRAMSQVGEMRDPYTVGHERRVSELATAIAAEMGVDGEQLEGLRLAGLIHDIGKIAVPAEILAKPGRLSAVEFDLIKQHAQAGHDILAGIDFGLPVAEVVLQHHERLDGSGYPQALRGEAVLPEARILAVADVAEAMSSHRPYRVALGIEAALDELRGQAGVKYDADVVAVCARLVEELGFRFSE